MVILVGITTKIINIEAIWTIGKVTQKGNFMTKETLITIIKTKITALVTVLIRVIPQLQKRGKLYP